MSQSVRDEEDDDVIVREACLGRPLREIGRTRGMTVGEVKRVIDREAVRYFSPEGLRRQMLLEARRLEELKQRLWVRAMKVDSELAVSVAYVKAAERFASLIGMNSPQGHVVNIIGGGVEPEEYRTSTQRLLETIRLLRHEEVPDDPEKVH